MALLGNENVSQELRQRAVGHVFDQMFKDKQLDATVGESQADRASREGIAAGNQWVEMQKMLDRHVLTEKDLAEIENKRKLGNYYDAQTDQINENLNNRVMLELNGMKVLATRDEAIRLHTAELAHQGKIAQDEQELAKANQQLYASSIKTRLTKYGGTDGEGLQAMFNKFGSGYMEMQKRANMIPGSSDAVMAKISDAKIAEAIEDKFYVDSMIYAAKYPTEKIPLMSIPESERQQLKPGRPWAFVDGEGAVLFLKPEGDSARILDIVPPGQSAQVFDRKMKELLDIYGL